MSNEMKPSSKLALKYLPESTVSILDRYILLLKSKVRLFSSVVILLVQSGNCTYRVYSSPLTSTFRGGYSPVFLGLNYELGITTSSFLSLLTIVWQRQAASGSSSASFDDDGHENRQLSQLR